MVSRRQQLQLDDNLKQLMKELGAAINDALSESEDISEAIQNVRNAGYDVFLVLEATIGFNKRSKVDGSGEEATANGLKSRSEERRVGKECKEGSENEQVRETI